jgi:hypothetical protein
MISSSSFIVFLFIFIGLMLTGEFSSLEEPTDVSEVAAAVVFLADRPNIYQI